MSVSAAAVLGEICVISPERSCVSGESAPPIESAPLLPALIRKFQPASLPLVLVTVA
jgi:hypothetical protein